MDVAGTPGNRPGGVLVDDVLAHFGVLGMHWGQHKMPVKRVTTSASFTTASGEVGTLQGQKVSPLARGISHIIPPLRDKINNSDMYDIKNAAGKKVGELYARKDPEEKNATNVVWIETDKSQKGKGYATGVMRSVIDLAKKAGRDKVTLEVPGVSPDAAHIYEKLGFVSKGGYKNYNPHDIWGGLIRMELDLTDSLAQADAKITAFLKHFGVKGMHWGQHMGDSAAAKRIAKDTQTFQEKRRLGASSGTRKTAEQAVKDSGGLHNVSDEHLNMILNRLNMEKRFNDIINEDIKRREAGREAALRVLGEIGKAVLPAIATIVAAKVATGGNSGHQAPFHAGNVNVPIKVIEGVSRALTSH
jgi:ribosomal protein S18 acetylase RimI-like enzyme